MVVYSLEADRCESQPFFEGQWATALRLGQGRLGAVRAISPSPAPPTRLLRRCGRAGGAWLRRRGEAGLDARAPFPAVSLLLHRASVVSQGAEQDAILRELRRDLHVQLPGIAPEPLGDGRELFAAGGVAGAGVGDFVDRGD